MASISIRTQQGYSTALLACSASGTVTALYHDGALAIDSVLYTDSAYTVGNEYNGNDLWWALSSSCGSIQINNVGKILAISNDICIPTITLIGSNSITIEAGTAYSELGATASDSCDGNITSNIVIAGTLNTNVPGTYTKTYNVSDAAGNDAVQVTRTINVVDTTIPVITLLGNSVVTLVEGGSYVDAGATATDNIDGNITSSIVTTGTVNTNVPGTYTKYYNVSDSAGNAATQVTRTIIVNADGAPVAYPATYSVAWNDFLNITLTGTDDYSTNLTYNIVSQPTKGILSRIGAVGSATYSYEHTASLQGSDSFTYTVTDGAGQTSVAATITIDPINAAPVITNPGTIVVTQNSFVNFNLTITDSDGDNITLNTITSPQHGNIVELGRTGNVTSVKYTPNVGYFGSDSWTITASDSKGAESSSFNVLFNVQFTPRFQMEIGSFGNDPTGMCFAPKNNTAYGSTLQANNVSQLGIGESIYYDANLSNIVIPSNASPSFIPVSDSSGSKILQISVSGEILAVENCNNLATSSFTNVKYATNSIAYCSDDYQNVTIWYAGDVQKTLTELVQDNTPVFSSEYYSNLYTSTTGATVLGTIDSGIYSEISSTTVYYKRSTTNTWGTDAETGSLEWVCLPPVSNVTHELTLIKKTSLINPNINQFCQAPTDVVSLFYVLPQGEPYYTNLLELAKKNTPIYKSSIGASTEDVDDLFTSNIFADDVAPNGGYLVWENAGDGVNFKWYGYNGNGQLVSGANMVTAGQCDDYIKPGVTTNSIVSPNPSVNSVNVFYGFYSCNPEIEGPQGASTNQTTESLFWPIYVIDGLHTNEPGDTGSYIKDFIDTLTYGNVIKTSSVDSCMEYSFKIVAEDIDDAILLLKSHGITNQQNQQRPIISSGTQIGLGSESIVDVYTNVNTSQCIVGNTSGIESTYTFPLIDGYDTLKAGPNFNTQTNYQLDNVAKPLLRTNPKLSGNIKIVTSSDGSVYLESISASKELAAIKYKKKAINPNGNYAADAANFFKANGTPSDLIYLTKRSESDLTVLDSYDKQIEEEYQYGTTYNYSKNYTENYRIFAPIWADNNMPNNFVIFKVKNPSNTNVSASSSDSVARIDELLKNAEIVKTFDLSKNSNLGKYIRAHVQQETFPKSPLTVSFDKNQMTSFNGIDINSGELTSKGEYIYKDYVETDKPLIEANDFITDGFRRNGVLCANLLNLEFLFDDESSTNYSVSRYFGLYVDSVDSGIGEINSINNNIIKFSSLTSYVNPNDPITAIPSHKQMTTSPTLGYVAINGVYYKISNSGLYDPTQSEVKIDDTTGNIPSAIGISPTGKSVDLIKNDDRGYDFVKMSIIEAPDSGDKIAVIDSREESYKFTFIKHNPGETININIEDSTGPYQFQFITSINFGLTSVNMVNAWNSFALNSELRLDIDVNAKTFIISEIKTNLGDLNMYVSGAIGSIVRVDQIQTNVNIQDRTYTANYTLPKGTYSGKFFSNQGTLGDIASALAEVIHNDESPLDAYNIGSDIWVKARIPGYKLLQHTVLVNKANVVDFVDVNNKDTNNILKLREGNNAVLSNWYAYYLSGGNSTSKSVFINNTTLSEISIGDYLETKYANVFNRVLDIVEDITMPNSTRSKLILHSKFDIGTGEARVFNDNIARIGLFSAYDVYDMNFDFYDKSNSDLKELKYETRSNINYEPYEHTLTNIDPITGEFNTKLDANDIFNDDYALTPVNYFSNLSGILSEEKIDQVVNVNIESEFDRLKENQLKEFATNSRVVPNINKWVLKDSLTVRDQPYYLNTNEAFGRTNFSPDITATGRNKNDMTHEWFYMDKKPKYLKYDELNDTFSYINFIEDFELTADLFKSTKNNYFDKFMITEGFEKNLSTDDITSIFNKFGEFTSGYLNPDDVNNTFFKTTLKKKYTLIDGGDTDAFASTIFKGLKVVFKNRKEFANNVALDFVKSSEFNGYKFSILLKTNNDAKTNGVDFEVIQNKKFKFVIFFINLNLSDYWVKDNMNRKLLYELNHKIVYDHELEDYTYANTQFDGALKWNSANFTGPSPYTIEGYNHIDGTTPNFDNQILLGENGLYGEVLMDIYPNQPGNTIYKFSVYSVEDSDTLRVVSKPVNVNDPNDILDVQYLPNYIQGQIKYYYKDGGTNIHKTTLEKLSINSVANMINLNDDSVKYTTIEEDGTVNNNRFTINFEDGTEIIKYATLSIEEDNDKPKSYKLFKGIIGYNLVKSDETSYYPFLIRHNGSYTVDFRPVITFTDMYTHFKSNRIQASADQRETGLESILYKHSLSDSYDLNTAKSYYERYNRCGTTFNVGFIQDDGSHDNYFGVIKNHFYHKVNETNPSGITKLSESADKLPLYPLIDEVAISKKDVNVFRSSWDFGYYTRSYSGGISEDVPGTLDNTEERSYFASTAMKIKDNYDLISFTYQNIESKEMLDDILKNSTNESEVLLFEDDNEIVADFYIVDIATRVLKEDGVLSRIQSYVSPENSAGDKTTLSDDANFYINKNIIEQFVVDSVKLFTKRFKGAASSIVSINDINLIGTDGFSPDNNFTYKQHKQKPMNFRLIYNKRLGYSYDIKPMIKIKS